ncbi:hypothetical protein G6O69_03410 [Pseudenhygromyxa sp. WMMC2535]|uniref:multiheme c-type cytochrome n=1 Tax=Pseudenhygromyxa sp. WMMC2535 TaxID=2712867 RepID=UPI001595B704|nr:multiheme c-type cytochrome [Pseudenhygromyxa sp. WMMC2535]NVB36862.1 hypothetical protein [Pseudenhygromyxa sp. WMMC2535]
MTRAERAGERGQVGEPRRARLEGQGARSLVVAALVVAAGVGLGVGCRQDAPDEPSVAPSDDPSGSSAKPGLGSGAGSGIVEADSEAGPIAAPLLPRAHASFEFAPALFERAPGPAPVSGRELLDADTCGSCHEGIVSQWRTSAHAFASFDNPIYRVSIDRFREQRGGFLASQFCGGCHDPALLVDGVLAKEVAPTDARAHVGVACRSCHGVESSQPDGNGSYRLASTPIPIPDLEDPLSIAEHRESMDRGAARDQCESCHRAFLGEHSGHPHHLDGTDDPGPWRDSSYAGNKLRLDTPVDERACADCHMPSETLAAGLSDPAADEAGSLQSHRFIGGHSQLAAMRGDDETVARIQAFLKGVASVDIAAVEVEGERHLLGAGLKPEDLRGRVVVDLVVRNLAVGHRFPGGTRDSQGAWLSLRVVDQAGRVIASLDESTGEVHRLRAGLVDDAGELVSAREVERLRAVAFDHTVAPRDAVVVRYALELPTDARAAGPLTVEAELLHRSRTQALTEETCAESKTPRGRAFLAATRSLLGQRLDPCATPPVTQIARHALVLGAAGELDAPRPEHERLWELGLGLSHQVQERLPEAREALDAALVALDAFDEGGDGGEGGQAKRRAKARILAALGAVAARQGRVDEALDLADRVEVLEPGHPFPEILRGRALAKVWRWEQAVPHLERAFAANPGSPKLAAELATALGSVGWARRSLEVAVAGLALRPRDEDLLRAQALALRALGDPRAEAALAAYLDHRAPDIQPHLASDCGERDPACARERVPVHVHE